MGASTVSHAVEWFPAAPIWQHAPLAIAIALVGAFAGAKLRLPGGPFLAPMAIGLIAKLGFGTSLELPMPVLALSYAVIGWSIGLRFTPEALTHAARMSLQVLLSIAMLVAICAGFAALLVRFAGIDPLTAYLATSPGGADSVAIIAASSKVDMPFIMAMQVGRFLLILVAGPALARFLSRGEAGR